LTDGFSSEKKISQYLTVVLFLSDYIKTRGNRAFLKVNFTFSQLTHDKFSIGDDFLDALLPGGE